MLNYSSFKNDFILESIINESIIYFSPKFRDYLKTLSQESEIAKELINIEGDDIKPDITFIDVDSEKEGWITFTTMKDVLNKMKDKISEDGKRFLKDVNHLRKSDRIELSDLHNRYNTVKTWSESRNPYKIGRFVNKVLPNKFTAKEVEDFTNQFKALKERKAEKFKLVSGDDIAYWYDHQRYKMQSGQLGNSCMKGKPDYYFQIYTKNPEVCQLLILIEDEKLLGRALVWKLDKIDPSHGEGDTYFMDRQYCSNDSDLIKFKNYAKDKGWTWKTGSFVSSEDRSNYLPKMEVQLNPTDDGDFHYEYYPYLDTFQRYDPNTGRLFNDEDESSKNAGQFILNSTGGDYNEIFGGFYSEYYDTRIPDGEAVWSDYLGSYIWADESVLVSSGHYRNHGWYPDDHEDVVYDEISEIYLNIDDATYLERYGHFIWNDNLVSAIDDTEKDGEPITEYYHDEDDNIISTYYIRDEKWYKKLSEEFPDWEYESYVSKDILIKNHNDKWTLFIFKVIAYKVIGSENDYLDELDAELLDKKIDKSEKLIMDKFEYYSRIKPLLKTIESEAKLMTKRIDLELQGKGQLKIKFPDEDENLNIAEKSLLRNKLSDINSKIEDIENSLFID